MVALGIFLQSILYTALFTASLASGIAWGEPVKGNPQNYWGHGMVIGSMASTYTTGCIWPSHELEVYTGVFHRRRKHDRYTLQLSTYDQDLFEKLEEITQEHIEAPPDHQQRIVLRYLHPSPYTLMGRNQTYYYVIEQTKPEQDFSKSLSCQEHGYEYEDKGSIPCYCYKSVVHGRIFHVQRWGGSDKICTVSIEEEQYTEEFRRLSTPKVIIQHIHAGKNVKIPVYTHKNSMDDSTISTISTIALDAHHDRYDFDIHSEEGCKFAEDAALAMEKVSFYYVVSPIPGKYWLSRTVYKLKVQNAAKNR